MPAWPIPRRHRRGLPASLTGLAVLAVLLTVWGASTDIVRGTLRERSFDVLLPLLPRPAIIRPSVVVIDIDRASLARFGPWP